MQFANKTAFVTGGASGIGLAIVRALLNEGVNVVIADVERKALDVSLKSLSNYGDRVVGVTCDVSLREDLESAAAYAFATFGKVHLLFNNAGVSRAGRAERVADSDWDWVLGVNLRGTIYGTQIFLPHMQTHGEGGHIVNTASIAGVAPRALAGPYAAAKFGVVGLSEVMAAELEGTNIGVSVLCPGMVRTAMVRNGRNRPQRFGGGFALEDDLENAERNARYLADNLAGLDAETIPPLVLRAIRENRLYIFTQPEHRSIVEARFARIRAGFDALET